MPKSIAIAAAIFVLGLAAAGSPRAAEMPGASIGGSAAAESGSAREDAAPSAARVVGGTDSSRKHVHPDSANEVREASARSSLGAESAGGSADIAPKRHRGGAWQALLPGVIK